MCLKQMRMCFLCLVLIFLADSALPMSRPVTRTEDQESIGTLENIWLPPDLGEEEKAEWKNGVPPGWSRGKKTGWRGRKMPPGQVKKQGRYGDDRTVPQEWDKWGKEQQETWKERLEKIRERIRKTKNEEDAETMLYSAEEAAKTGVPLQELESVTERFMKRNLTAEEYEKTTRAMAYGVGKKVDFRQLGNFVNSNIEQDVRGNELAINIYKEIAARSGK